MLTTEYIRRCGRCDAILTQEELDTNRYPDIVRCGGCVSRGDGIAAFLRIDGVRAPNATASQREWLRRVHLATTPHSIYIAQARVSAVGRVE